jgi:hypothetical protein
VSEELVGEIEKREISGQVQRILRDLGNPEPPLNLADVRSVLSLDLQYYRSTDPGLIQELTHRFNLLARKTIPGLGRHIVSALAKSKLCAFWVPESARILLDQEVPAAKHRWIEAHEITHSVTPWHKDFLLGDDKQTLDPACHAVLEAEANYGAGRLLFLQERFSADARDLTLNFGSVKQLADRYENSIVSTFWRTVEERNPGQAVFGLISVHPHHADIGAHDGGDPWRYFIRSALFRTQFANVPPAAVFDLIARHASRRRTGPILLADDILADATGKIFEFRIESFSNKYALLTLGFPLRERPLAVAVA